MEFCRQPRAKLGFYVLSPYDKTIYHRMIKRVLSGSDKTGKRQEGILAILYLFKYNPHFKQMPKHGTLNGVTMIA